MASISASMDLFISEPLLRNESEDATVSFSPLETSDYDSLILKHDEADMIQKQTMEADFAANFQTRSLDFSMYTTYTDLSSLATIDHGSPEDHTTNHTATDDIQFDQTPYEIGDNDSLLDSIHLLESRGLNKSLDSILLELSKLVPHSYAAADSNGTPIQRSFSLNDLENSANDDFSNLTDIISTLSDYKLNHVASVDNTLVKRRAYEESQTTSTENSRAFVNGESELIGNDNTETTPAFMINESVPRHNNMVNNEEFSAVVDSSCPASRTNQRKREDGSGGELRSRNVYGNISEINECFSTEDNVVVSGENISVPGDFVLNVSVLDRTKMEQSEEKFPSKETDMMKVIDSLKREATMWENKYVEMRRRFGSSSSYDGDVACKKDFLAEMKVRSPEDVVKELQTLLRDSECRVEDARDEIEELREEIEDMKLELDEAADRVREGDLEEFRDMKHDLDQVSKECRILQYRLRKADRRLEQLEHEKNEVEDKLQVALNQIVPHSSSTDGLSIQSVEANQTGSEKTSASSTAATSDEEDKASEKEVANLKQQLKVAKDVSVRLHQELEMIEEKRARTEEDNFILKKRLMDTETSKREIKRDLEKSKLEVELLRRKITKTEETESSEKFKEKVRCLRASTSSDDTGEYVEYDIAALLNDLQESNDREGDLQSQLQLVEEESLVIRKSLGEFEQEKESLEFELERYKMRFGTLDDPKRPDNVRGVSSEKEAELRLQLMVADQEATVMRRRLIEMEAKNEELEGALARLSERLPDEEETPLVKLSERQTPIGEEADSSKPERGPSSDLDSLQRQLDSLEQENDTLRLKLNSHEESENFVKECLKNVSIAIGSEPKISTDDVERIVETMKRRVMETEFRNKCYELEIRTLKKLNDAALGGPRDSSSKATRLKGLENKLKSQLSLLHDEADIMRRKVIALEMTNERLQEDLDKKPTDSHSSPGRLGSLQEKIVQLEQELGDLLTIIKSKEATQVQQDQEIIELRDTYEKLQLASESSDLEKKRKLAEAEYKKEVLEQQLKIVKERAESMQGHLQRLCSVADPPHHADAELSDDVFESGALTREADTNVEIEKILTERITVLEEQLAEERQRNSAYQRDVVERTLQETCDQLLSPDDEGERELLSFELDESRLEIEDLRDEITKTQDSLKREVEDLSIENVELKSLREKLQRENEQVQSKLAMVRKEKNDVEEKHNKETENLKKNLEKMKINAEKEQTELKRALHDLQSEVDKLSFEKEAAEGREMELHINVENLSKIFEEAECAREDTAMQLRETEEKLLKQTIEFETKIAKDLRAKTEETQRCVKEKENALRTKEEEMIKLQGKFDAIQKEVISLRTSRTQEIDKENAKKKSESSRLESEKSKLEADVASLQKTLAMKEETWKTERSRFLKEVSELRQKVKDKETEENNKVKQIESRLEAATELVESYKTGEARFMEERRKLIKQVEDKDIALRQFRVEMEKRISEKNEKDIENTRKEFEKKLQRQEKVWRNEQAAYKFKLEAESKYFNDEVRRLHRRLESETSDYNSLKEQITEKNEEVHRLRVQLDVALNDFRAAKMERDRELLSARRSRQLLEDTQREKRDVSVQLSSEKNRSEGLQRAISAEKAGWQVTHAEMQSRLTRLESQTKLKKVKLEELQARLQAAWDHERAENMRLLTEANQKILKLESEVQDIDERRKREAAAVGDGLAVDKKNWEEDSSRLHFRIRANEQEIQSLKEGEKRNTQLDLRYQKERDQWRKERNELLERLQNSLDTRRKEHKKIDELIHELSVLKCPLNGGTPRPEKSHEEGKHGTKGEIKQGTKEEIKRGTKEEAKHGTKEGIRKKAGQSWPLKKQPSEPNIQVGEEEDRHFQEVLDQLQCVQDDLSNYQCQIRQAFAAKLKRSVSEYDVPMLVTRQQAWMQRTQSHSEMQKSSTDSDQTTISYESISSEQSVSEKKALSPSALQNQERAKSPVTQDNSLCSPSSGKTTLESTDSKISVSSNIKTISKTSSVTVSMTLQSTPQGELKSLSDGPASKMESPKESSSVENIVKVIAQSTSTLEQQNVHQTRQESTETTPLKLNVKGTGQNVSQNGAHSPDIISDKDKRVITAQGDPLKVRSGRFDARSILRETDKTSGSRLRSVSPGTDNLQRRLAEMEKSRVLSAKKLFEGGTKTSLSSKSGSGVNMISPGSSDSDSDRGVDPDSVLRRQRNQIATANAVANQIDSMAKRSSDPVFMADRISRSVERNRSWSPRTTPTDSPSSSRTSPSPSPTTHTPRYPSAPPGFLLPKQIKSPNDPINDRRGSLDSLNPAAPPRPKPYNVPIPPSELASFNEAPLKVLPGQLAKTKNEIKNRLKNQNSSNSNSLDSPPSPLKAVPSQILTEEKQKLISPRSARAYFFAEPPSIEEKVITQSGNGNNNKVQISNSNANMANIQGSTSSLSTEKQKTSRFEPPSRASPWSASPASPIQQAAATPGGKTQTKKGTKFFGKDKNIKFR